MLKYIGVTIFILGAGLLLYSIISSKKDGYKEAKAELSMITSAGYATHHVEATRPEAVLNQTPIKAAPRQRTLSKEALDLLDIVEDEREKERIEELNKPKKKKGTDLLIPQKKPKGTDILQPEKKSTDILPTAKKGTDIMSINKGTDIMASGGTDILANQEASANNKESKIGTDILPTEKKGTDILGSPSTGVPPTSKGTDILAEE